MSLTVLSVVLPDFWDHGVAIPKYRLTDDAFLGVSYVVSVLPLIIVQSTDVCIFVSYNILNFLQSSVFVLLLAL